MKLSQILAFAIKHDACDAQLNKFKGFIESGDTLSAWQTVQGNIDWLKGENRLRITNKELEEKSGGVGKTWFENGVLKALSSSKNGKLDGLDTRFYSNGQKQFSIEYKKGIRDGLDTGWYANGQLWYECTYNNGKIGGMYREYLKDGKLKEERFHEINKN